MELAQSSNDRRTKVASSELLHAVSLYMIGISAKAPLQRRGEEVKEVGSYLFTLPLGQWTPCETWMVFCFCTGSNVKMVAKWSPNLVKFEICSKMVGLNVHQCGSGVKSTVVVCFGESANPEKKVAITRVRERCLQGAQRKLLLNTASTCVYLCLMTGWRRRDRPNGKPASLVCLAAQIQNAKWIMTAQPQEMKFRLIARLYPMPACK